MSKIEVQGPQGDVQEWQRLMIIELERYNKIGELLIENRITGSQRHVCYQDGGWGVSVTTVAVHMGVKGMECNRAQGNIQLSSKLGMRAGTHTTTVEQ